MPQLNPAPWLSYFLLTWLILLCLVIPKTSHYLTLNQPKAKKLAMFSPKWLWPW